ncbi:hypothetical protein VNO77_09786 [Canavalia gladiata]|uniref:Uncharacterized protein n=1 Tax=Canavalia gladiata TaxID=3824 RepID=A0AAN9QXI4_CANGL
MGILENDEETKDVMTPNLEKLFCALVDTFESVQDLSVGIPEVEPKDAGNATCAMLIAKWRNLLGSRSRRVTVPRVSTERKEWLCRRKREKKGIGIVSFVRKRR